MGLDMYLEKRMYIGWDERSKLKITGIKEKFNIKNVKGIVEEVGYWRKANAIHGWFVNNVQDGKDDCKDYHVNNKQLKELLDLVNKVITGSKLVKGKISNGYRFEDGKKTPIFVDGRYIKDNSTAKKLLPVSSGFFFGNSDEETAYDEYYLDDLKLTKKILEKALTDDSADYYYSSSW